MKTSSISVNRAFKTKSTSSELDVTFNKDILSTAVPLKQRHQNLIPIDKEKEIDKIFNGTILLISNNREEISNEKDICGKFR